MSKAIRATNTDLKRSNAGAAGVNMETGGVGKRRIRKVTREGEGGMGKRRIREGEGGTGKRRIR